MDFLWQLNRNFVSARIPQGTYPTTPLIYSIRILDNLCFAAADQKELGNTFKHIQHNPQRPLPTNPVIHHARLAHDPHHNAQIVLVLLHLETT